MVVPLAKVTTKAATPGAAVLEDVARVDVAAPASPPVSLDPSGFTGPLLQLRREPMRRA